MMFILFVLLVFCFILCFVYFYNYLSKLEHSIDELYDLFYRNEYDFELEKNDRSVTFGGKCVEGFRSFLGND